MTSIAPTYVWTPGMQQNRKNGIMVDPRPIYDEIDSEELPEGTIVNGPKGNFKVENGKLVAIKEEKKVPSWQMQIDNPGFKKLQTYHPLGSNFDKSA